MTFNLDTLAGRCISFMLAVPAAILYTREMNSAISLGIKSQSNITLDGYLQREIISWRFLDNWKGKLKWKSENHIPLQCSLMHQLLNGAAFSKSTEFSTQVGDSWETDMISLPIMVLEARALLNVLKSLSDKIKGHRVDANVDNQALICVWNNEGSKSFQLNYVIKEIFQFTLDFDIILNLCYIPSKDNIADLPSRSITKCDATITRSA